MATWPDYKHHNTFDLLSKVYTKRTSNKAIILLSCLLDVLPKHSNTIVDKDFRSF